ncbi:MAG: MFS transporter [Anaerolineales bacterium]|nr:MFS transporter [Anaerolineales bacterium]
MIKNISQTYREYSPRFWILTGATFIDHLGGMLLFPFFSLYITSKFGVGMVEVGFVFTIYSASSFIGSIIGGALTDKFGRRWMLLFGIVVSGASSLLMAFVDEINLFYVMTLLVGFLENTGGPAQQAMVADLVPEEKRSGGYGIQRVAVNLSATIGPAVGGLIASRSFFWLFVLDAVFSLITAVIVYFTLPETMPQSVKEQPENGSFFQTMSGYRQVLKDSLFMTFILITILTIMSYAQLNSTLAVYLRDYHGILEKQYGYLLSLNAILIVLFQFWATRRTDKHPPLRMMALSALFFAIGFGMFGLIDRMAWFVVAIIIITIGEMINAPVSQSLAARLAPESMRGRYMAMYGFSWSIPYAIGPLLAGIIMDNADPRLVWYACGTLGVIATVAFLRLHNSVRDRLQPTA